MKTTQVLTSLVAIPTILGVANANAQEFAYENNRFQEIGELMQTEDRSSIRTEGVYFDRFENKGFTFNVKYDSTQNTVDIRVGKNCKTESVNPRTCNWYHAFSNDTQNTSRIYSQTDGLKNKDAQYLRDLHTQMTVNHLRQGQRVAKK
jgi:hypothetical protein